MTFTIDDAAFKRDFKKVLSAETRATQQGLRAASRLLSQEAKRGAPKDSGALRGSITRRKQLKKISEGVYEDKVFPAASYTKTKKATYTRGGWKKSEASTKTTNVRLYRAKAEEATHFMANANAKTESAAHKIMEDTYEAAFRRATGGV